MASLAERTASPWTATSMRDRPAGCSTCASSLCGAVCSNGRWLAADVDGLLVPIDRRRRFDAAPAMMVPRRRGATNTTLAVTRRHRCRHRMLRSMSLSCARRIPCRTMAAMSGLSPTTRKAPRGAVGLMAGASACSVARPESSSAVNRRRLWQARRTGRRKSAASLFPHSHFLRLYPGTLLPPRGKDTCFLRINKRGPRKRGSSGRSAARA